MAAFLIVVGIILVVNIIFIAVSLFLTVFSKDTKENRSRRPSQLSVAQIILSRQHMASRGSLPQVTLFNTFVRVSTGTTPSGITQSFRQNHSNTEDVNRQKQSTIEDVSRQIEKVESHSFIQKPSNEFKVKIITVTAPKERIMSNEWRAPARDKWLASEANLL